MTPRELNELKSWVSGTLFASNVCFYYRYCTAPFTFFKKLGIPGPETTPFFGSTASLIFQVNWVLMCLLSQTSAGQLLVDRLLLQRKGRRKILGTRFSWRWSSTRSKLKCHRKWSRIQHAAIGARWINLSDLINLDSYEVKNFQAGTDTPWCNYNFVSIHK